MEEEAREYIHSLHIEDDAVDKYSLPEQQQQQQQQQQQEQEPDTEFLVEEIPPAEEASASLQSEVNNVHEAS
ncbi:MAG: hypothetical protein N6V41_01595, partial [Candidatus Portiera aleyrodidarum]|nr:hypothetical protein [Candidatus Portiera aleyrodidarum]